MFYIWVMINRLFQLLVQLIWLIKYIVRVVVKDQVEIIIGCLLLVHIRKFRRHQLQVKHREISKQHFFFLKLNLRTKSLNWFEFSPESYLGSHSDTFNGFDSCLLLLLNKINDLISLLEFRLILNSIIVQSKNFWEDLCLD